MKQCAYCGRDNTDEAPNCRECGTEFEQLHKAAIPEEPKQLELSRPEHPSGISGGLKSIASLTVDEARDLLERLKKEGIPAAAKPVTQVGGLEYSDIMVEDRNYERACDVAEAWEADCRAETERRSNRFCPRCGSRHLGYVTTETFGTIWKCKDCGNDFAK